MWVLPKRKHQRHLRLLLSLFFFLIIIFFSLVLTAERNEKKANEEHYNNIVTLKSAAEKAIGQGGWMSMATVEWGYIIGENRDTLGTTVFGTDVSFNPNNIWRWEHYISAWPETPKNMRNRWSSYRVIIFPSKDEIHVVDGNE